MFGSEVVQRVKALAAKATKFVLTTGTQILEGQNILLSSLHKCAKACMHVHTYSHTYKKTVNK